MSDIPKINLSLIFFFLLSVGSIAQEKKVKTADTTACLKIMGMTIEENKPIDGIQVTLYKENEGLEWDEITSIKDHEHRFVFQLQGNSYYTIEVSKGGYVKRLIGISTILPGDGSLNGKKYDFDFEVLMFKEKAAGKDPYIDFPVALIAYDDTTMKFEENATYEKHIKSKLNETLNQKDSTQTSGSPK
ncbi:MAG: hypothetical protein A3F72_11985 [Bacteroidetes bacterium RIFCSPLOWO2_12_FULL_35_15]|nr:MAG: hypothetical protein A3F72_11985 [Bacteroidetes bacterium RIFCSPLOWO2_12_FULL_35_15]